VTRKSINEYSKAIRERYLKGTKEEKGKILDEFTKVTGIHRKAAIRLLNHVSPPDKAKRSGRKRKYDVEIVKMLKIIWEASDRLCSKRLKPFIPEIVGVLCRHGELQINACTEAQLCKMSAATIDRQLQPYRKSGGRRGFTTTRPGNMLKKMIPIRTFTDWQENKAGFVEIDLVAHCGESADNFFLNTLCAVDVWSGWTECLPVWGKWQEKVRQAVHHMRERFPFPLLGIDSDNGGEFINMVLYKYCRDEKITLTRSRSYKKNDSCHVEQKNGNVVRRIVGYDRYTTKASYECLDRLYYLVRLQFNFFQPTMKLVNKTRHGAKVYKIYETAQTPYQRLLRANMLTGAKKAELAATYRGLNPVALLKQINANLEQLWRLADRQLTHGNRIYEATRRASVTL
jgi:hypothetical protein